jgi:hypothetical protein
MHMKQKKYCVRKITVTLFIIQILWSVLMVMVMH